jgi:hypothetical protein
MKKLSLSTLEIVASLLLVIYLLVDVSTPNYMKSILKTQMGMIILLVLLVLIGVYANPLVTILVIFAAYEMVRRSLLEGFEEPEPEEDEESGSGKGEVKYDEQGRELGPDGKPLPDSDEEDDDDKEQTEVLPDEVDGLEGFQNLETEIVKDMAPVGKSNKIVYNVSSYKPVENNVNGTSLFV